MTRLPPLDADAMAEWSALLRDDNAIHLSRQAAEAAGFGPGRVNPGPANLALVLSQVMQAHPAQGFRRITAEFTGNAFEGDVLEVALHPGGGTLSRDGTALVLVHFQTGEDPDERS